MNGFAVGLDFLRFFFYQTAIIKKIDFLTCQTIVSYLTSVPFLVYLGFFQAIIFQLKQKSLCRLFYSRETQKLRFRLLRKIWLHSKRQNMSLLSVSLVRTFVLKLILLLQSPPKILLPSHFPD